MQGEFYIDNKDGAKIDPATEDKQREIVNHLAQSIVKNSLNWGTKRVTIQGDGTIVGPDQPCRTCVVSHGNTTTYVGATAEGTPDATSFLLPTKTYLEIPVRNVNKLSFFGTAGEFIHILWRD